MLLLLVDFVDVWLYSGCYGCYVEEKEEGNDGKREEVSTNIDGGTLRNGLLRRALG